MGMNLPDDNDYFSIDHVNQNTQALDIVGKPDEYKTTKTYAVGDLCIYDNVLYKCITAVEIAESFDVSKWETTNVLSEIAEQNKNFAKLNEKIYTQQFTSVADSAGRISTALSADKVKIISARVISPRNEAQYGINVTVNPNSVQWYLDCAVLANMQVTYEVLIYKI